MSTNAWRSLHAPLILGEVGAAVAGNHYQDQRLDASAVGYLLRHGRQAGASAVLAHAGDHVLYERDRSRLTDRARSFRPSPADFLRCSDAARLYVPTLDSHCPIPNPRPGR